MGSKENITSCLKGVVSERNTFNFNEYPRPNTPWSETIIYELHVDAFTHRLKPTDRNNNQGNFLGIIEKLPYLKELGITAIELLPVFTFDPTDAPEGLNNYWGYSPINWFAPHYEYISGSNPKEGRNQFRKLVENCHYHGIEVILDVVYNHTSEGGKNGPIISWKGFASDSYYHQDDDNNFLDVTGCGNTISANNPITRKLILESMRCWAIELGVDGFRFDLGIALSRGEKLTPLDNPGLFEEIEADPYLSDLKIVSEPWDCGGLYRLKDFPAKRIGTWNGKFRDGARRFWKGEKNSAWDFRDNLMGGQDLYKGKINKIQRSINFITSHDGFTLNDLVSFNYKHNLSNGEENRDGENHNNSFNYGVEGPSIDKDLIKLRNRQKRNLLGTMLLSPGIPMLLMGDEVGRSQGGNNNTWCQNSDLSWMIWDEDICDLNLYSFVKKLIRIRLKYPKLFCKIINQLRPKDNYKENQDELWIQWHGVKLGIPDWSDWSHTVSYSINKGATDYLCWFGFNAYTKSIKFEIPEPSTKWIKLVDTFNENDKNAHIPLEQIKSNFIEIESRSFVLLMKEGHIAKGSI